MRLPVGAAAVVLAAVLGAAACAPRNTNTTQGEDIGRTASVGFGTIVSRRPVVVPVQNSGAGSFIGRDDVRGNILGALGGTIGNPVGNRVGRAQAVEFIIREDTGETVSVVQTDEENFHPGERVVITGGARTRLARGAPPSSPGT